MTINKDSLFNTSLAPSSFEFDDKVADVFEDMISRSVPGYSTIISMIGLLAQQYCTQNSNVYDLGCSLGAATIAIHKHVPHNNYRLIAVDNSSAMIEKLRNKLQNDPLSSVDLEIQCSNILETPIEQASVVVLNFTLQFIQPGLRAPLIERIYTGLRPAGILVLSEKLAFDNPQIQQLQIDMHHSFKRANGYSELEISQKRNALEKVLIPETLAAHKRRLRKAGFSSVEPWFQCFNFTSLVAIK